MSRAWPAPCPLASAKMARHRRTEAAWKNSATESAVNAKMALKVLLREWGKAEDDGLVEDTARSRIDELRARSSWR